MRPSQTAAKASWNACLTDATSTGPPVWVRSAKSWIHTGVGRPAGVTSKGCSVMTLRAMCSSIGSTSDSATGLPS